MVIHFFQKNKNITRTMGIWFLLLFIQTNVVSALTPHNLLFNIYFNGKCKTYLEKEKIQEVNHSPVFAFGHTRMNNSSYKWVSDEEQYEALFQKDWSDFALKTVVLDPGHGGKDDGTSAKNGAKEKNVALAIAKRLGVYIKANYPNVNVIYTRSTDIFVPLKKRAKIANDNKADLFISIHCNSFKSSSVNGLETYVMGLEKAGENMAVIKRENDVVLLEEDYENQYEEYGVDKDSPLYDILMNSYQNAYLDQSLAYAESLDNNVKSSGTSTRGVHQAGFVVLKRTAMPSVLVETGYLSNKNEMEKLSSKKGQDEMAYQLYAAFSDFKMKMENSKPKDVTTKTINHSSTKSMNTSTKSESFAPNSNKKIKFGIQLASVRRKLALSEDKWKSIRNRIVIEKTREGRYRYVLKDFGANYSQVEKEKKELTSRGFSGCFVVAYKNQSRIDVIDAKKELGL